MFASSLCRILQFIVRLLLRFPIQNSRLFRALQDTALIGKPCEENIFPFPLENHFICQFQAADISTIQAEQLVAHKGNLVSTIGIKVRTVRQLAAYQPFPTGIQGANSTFSPEAT